MILILSLHAATADQVSHEHAGSSVRRVSDIEPLALGQQQSPAARLLSQKHHVTIDRAFSKDSLCCLTE